MQMQKNTSKHLKPLQKRSIRIIEKEQYSAPPTGAKQPTKSPNNETGIDLKKTITQSTLWMMR